MHYGLALIGGSFIGFMTWMQVRVLNRPSYEEGPDYTRAQTVIIRTSLACLVAGVLIIFSSLAL